MVGAYLARYNYHRGTRYRINFR